MGYSQYLKGTYDLLFVEKSRFHIKCRSLLRENQMTKAL